MLSFTNVGAVRPVEPVANGKVPVPLRTSSPISNTYSNNGANPTAPQIDALNVVNFGTFVVGTVLPFQTYDTVNFTNLGVMEGSPGFQFDNSSPTTPAHKLSGNFVNFNQASIEALDTATPDSPPIGCDIAVVHPSTLFISATNITLAAGGAGAGASLIAGSDGEIQLIGTNVDLSYSGLEILPTPLETVGNIITIANGAIVMYQPDIGIYDVNWAPLTAFTMQFPINTTALWNGNTAQAQGINSPPAMPNAQPPLLLAPQGGLQLFADGERIVNTTTTITVTNYPDPLNPTTPWPGIPVWPGPGNPPPGFGETLTNSPPENDTPISNQPSNVTQTAIFVLHTADTSVGDAFGGNGPPNDYFEEILGVSIYGALKNPVTGVSEASGITLEDSLGNPTGIGSYPATGLAANTIGCPTNTARPNNIQILVRGVSFPFASGFGVPPPDFFTSSGSIDFQNFPSPPSILSDSTTFPVNNGVLTSGNYAGYESLVDTLASRPPLTPAGTPTNNPGRVRIFAQNLDLTGARIRGEGEVEVNAAHILSTSNAVVDSPILKFNVGSETGNLDFKNLAPSTVARFGGTFTSWSTTFSNTAIVTYESYVLMSNIDTTVTPANTNYYQVLSPVTNVVTVNDQAWMIDARNLSDLAPVSTFDLSIHSQKTTVDDNLSVVNSILVDGLSLTVNGGITIPGVYPPDPRAPTVVGTPLQNWTAANAPNLLYLTNNGTMSIANEAHFGDDRAPYAALVNTATGTMAAGGLAFNSIYYENDGTIQVSSALFAQGDTGKFSGGSTISGTYMQFMGNNLKFNQHTLGSAGPLVFYITNSLSDAGAGSGNAITVEDGFQEMVKPATGDLLGTAVTTTTPQVPTYRAIHIWSGADRGPTAAGYLNNTALGSLTIATNSPNPVYFFKGTGVQNGLYVDLLDLSQLGTLAQLMGTNGTGAPAPLQIDPSLTIYYSAIKIGFTPPPASAGPGTTPVPQEPEEFMNGQFGGHLKWVPSFAGPNSSTPVVVFNPVTGQYQSIMINTALRNSQILDSNGNGIANANDPTPVSLAVMSVSTTGTGTVSPNYNAQPLIVGQTYSMTAQPGDGFMFTGWSGSVTSDIPTLTFVMTNGLGETANFAYLPGSGTYSGLFYQSGGIQVGESGSITITKSASGKFSGSLQLAANRYSFSGTLDGNGAATVSAGNSGITIQLQAGNAQMSGSVGVGDPPGKPAVRMALVHTPQPGNGAWSAPFQANLNVFSSKTNPAPYAGTYTIVFPGSGDASNTVAPLGYGYGSITVDTAGNVKFSGTLADGTKVTQSATVSQNGQWPLFIPLYSGNGQFLSWQTFGNTGAQDVGGMFNWIKPATNGKVYPAAFNVSGNAFGALYNAKLAPITGFGGGLLQFTGGNLSSALANTIAIGPNNRVTNLGPQILTMTLTPNQGFFSGTLTDPATMKKYNFNGAVVQKLLSGYGFLLGTNQTSQVTLTPNP